MKILKILVAILPLILFSAYLLPSRFIYGIIGVPDFLDWLMLFLSASLVALNPYLAKIGNGLPRLVAYFGGFIIWGGFLYFLTFYLIALTFEEGL